ncbi:unnamed protein product [Oikopleura dioica]|uniref:Uncharacterized protein n=1 Tax=Oikopleura dioica TaxID=34765 RepID=E4XUF4_OIKDI|nr:unnamed protein product [Oikopleura dioica]
MVPFSYLINSPTELDDWTFQPNNDTFEMLENNSAFAHKMNLTTRKTFEVLFGSEKIGEEFVYYKLTRPRTLAPARFPLVVFMPSDGNVQSERIFSFGMAEYFASKYKLSVLQIDGVGSELESVENFCVRNEEISSASSRKKINQIDSFLNKLTSLDGLANKNLMAGLDLNLNKTAFFGFENGANLALLAASIASYSVNCTLGLSLLPDFENYVSPASSKIMVSSNLREEILKENFKKLKLISPLDDDYISPIDSIAIDEKFGLQNDMSLKLLRGNSQSLLKSDYWDFYGEYFSTCLKEPSP